MTIYAFGDSHARYAFSQCANVKLHWLGPWTMHRVGRGGAPIVVQVERPGAGDTLIYMFGEIDVRYHLVRLAQERYQNISDLVDELTTRFLACITATIPEMNGRPKICVMGVVPPMDPIAPNPIIPVFGSFKDRRITRNLMNTALKDKCRQHGFVFAEIPKLYETKDGGLRPHLSDGHAHIAMDHAGPLCRAVERTIGEKLGHRGPPMLTRARRQLERHRALKARDALALWQLGEAV